MFCGHFLRRPFAFDRQSRFLVIFVSDERRGVRVLKLGCRDRLQSIFWLCLIIKRHHADHTTRLRLQLLATVEANVADHGDKQNWNQDSQHNSHSFDWSFLFFSLLSQRSFARGFIFLEEAQTVDEGVGCGSPKARKRKLLREEYLLLVHRGGSSASLYGLVQVRLKPQPPYPELVRVKRYIVDELCVAELQRHWAISRFSSLKNAHRCRAAAD